MTNRLNKVLLLAAALFATSAIVVALCNATIGRRHVDNTAPTPAPATTTAEAITLLPTVVVRPERQIPTLATVTVHATRRALLAGNAVSADQPATATSEGGGAMDAMSAMPSTAFDMPYYSFGKTLRRASKE